MSSGESMPAIILIFVLSKYSEIVGKRSVKTERQSIEVHRKISVAGSGRISVW